ncbi:MAG: beta-ketoacyl synthase N-terminal-like domain-containing protein, partial [Armatimonadota bacterium]|nr:beta-ketoacyl synthase N-terminal-like domain-containing protein [Armatimonadota bacterium]
MTKRRVVVTGIGVVTPIGIGKDRFWNALMEGRSGVRPIQSFDASRYPTRIAAEVLDFDPLDWMDRKEAKRNDRFVQFAIAATRMALEDARFRVTRENADRVGVVIGSGL